MNVQTSSTTPAVVERHLRREIDRGRWRPGEQLPSYGAIARLLGGSPATVMKAVNALEHQGLLTRLSPRKIAVAEAPRSPGNDGLPVGVVSLTGHVFEDMAHALVRRLYDRQTQSALIDPLGESDVEVRRWFARFFDERFRALVIRDNNRMRTDLFAEYRRQYDRLILIETPCAVWSVPYHGIFIDRAFLMQDALTRLAAAGCRRVHLLLSGGPPGAKHPRDQFETGLERFRESCPEVDVRRLNPHEMAERPAEAREWAQTVRDGDGVFGYYDWFTIKAQEWLHDHGAADLDRVRFMGAGNTPWSQHGPYRFASYDYRTEEMIDQALEWIDKPVEAFRRPLIRRIRPRLMRADHLT